MNNTIRAVKDYTDSNWKNQTENNKDTEFNTSNQVDFNDIYKTLQTITAKHTFLPSTLRVFSMLAQKQNFIRIKVI